MFDTFFETEGSFTVRSALLVSACLVSLLCIPRVECADPKPGEVAEVEIAKGLKMKFCWIPAGEAQLGSPKAERLAVDHIEPEPDWLAREAEEVRGKYKTKGFWLGKYAVTQEEWKAVKGKNPSAFSKEGTEKDDVADKDPSRFPVERVSWDDCQDFLKEANKTVKLPEVLGKGKLALPHEDQWEYACRGGKGNKQAFYFGDMLNGKQANCVGNEPFGTATKGPYLSRTERVGSYETEAPHPWGLCDMSGNVQQWCSNRYYSKRDREYEFLPDLRVVRGGSWISKPENCRSAYRVNHLQDSRYYDLGFRLVVSQE